MIGVALKVGAGFAGEGPAGPGSPFSLFESRFAEAVGVVLEVDARVSQKNFGGRILENVDQRLIGKRPGFENRLISF